MNSSFYNAPHEQFATETSPKPSPTGTAHYNYLRQSRIAVEDDLRWEKDKNYDFRKIIDLGRLENDRLKEALDREVKYNEELKTRLCEEERQKREQTLSLQEET